MRTRANQVWEAKSTMNGERVYIVLESRLGNCRFNEVVVHRVLHVTGKKLGRVLEWTERDGEWERDPRFTRLV